MNFHIVHTTEYEYSAAAIESYTELRVRPRNTLRQVVSHHLTEITPRVPLEVFIDYYGNWVEFLSVPFRHKRLIVTSRSAVQTRAYQDALSGLDLTISEAVHLCWPQRRELYDFLMPSLHAPVLPEIEEIARQHLPPKAPFAPAILSLNEWLFREFTYESGVTDISTPVSEVIANRKGVCQDFAHLMIAVLRSAGLPARYVSGYIETDADAHTSLNGAPPPPAPEPSEDSTRLIGATASHAWVEVFTPSGHWVGLDPTNNLMEGERHVQIGIGRDYADVSPLRGVFKGAEQQLLSVKVTVSRAEELRNEQDELTGSGLGPFLD